MSATRHAHDAPLFSRPFPGADDPRFSELDQLIAAGVVRPVPKIGGKYDRGLVLRGGCTPGAREGDRE